MSDNEKRVEVADGQRANTLTDHASAEGTGLSKDIISPTNTKRRRKPVDTKTGLAIGLAFLIISMFFYFQPGYFYEVTIFFQIFFLFFGLFGIGNDLDRLVKEKDYIPAENKFSGVFNNFGAGLAFLALWAIVLNGVPNIWGKAGAFLLFMPGVHFATLGLVNLIFSFLPGTAGSQNPVRSDNQPSDSEQRRASKAGTIVKVLAIFVSALTAFVAALLQILQILKILQ